MEQFSFSYQQLNISELDDTTRQLIDAATKATENAYAPYSDFRVGAAALLKDGAILTGSNHENASYPAGICAERAMLSALNPTYPAHNIKAIAVNYTGSASLPLSPCGICRQVILEHQLTQGTPIEMYMCSPAGSVIRVSDASMLLPFHFSSEHLDLQ